MTEVTTGKEVGKKEVKYWADQKEWNDELSTSLLWSETNKNKGSTNKTPTLILPLKRHSKQQSDY